MKKIIFDIFDKYMVFIKYIFSAGISFFVDIVLFSVFVFILKKFISNEAIIISSILARVISSFINYLLNGNVVFKSNEKFITRNTIIKYYILVVIQLFVSTFSVYFLYNLIKINETLIKIVVDVIIFIVNYFVQRKFIFVRK